MHTHLVILATDKAYKSIALHYVDKNFNEICQITRNINKGIKNNENNYYDVKTFNADFETWEELVKSNNKLEQYDLAENIASFIDLMN